MGFQNGWRGPNIVSDGLVLYLDAGSPNSYRPDFGTTWKDMSGFNNSGSLINGPTYSSANGGSIVFDGTNDYVIGSLSSSSNWTMCIWYLSTDITSKIVYYPFACTTGGNGLGFGGFFSADTQNKWYFFDGTTVFSNINTSIVINTWYNLVVTKTSTSYSLYTNGNLSLSATGVDLSCTQYTLGNRGDGQSFFVRGNIANALMYNKAISATEVLQNYNAQKSRFGL